MQLILFRHGIAVDRGDPGFPSDFDRPLTIDGKHKTEAAARGLRALGAKPDLIVSSPYLRCHQTARIALDVLGLSKQALATTEALLPNAPPEGIWAELRQTRHENVLIVGHGGTLEPIASHALGQVLEPALHLKKAGAMGLEVALEPALTARFEWLVTAKILRQLGR